ncbi:hypothetical protein [Clostridium sp. C8-1-8]|uniref:hypothetical protein n=1 Tax=Clostridium sp. C8-1-8 TaxID=2698831 RepID=UPI00136B8C7B|nr:hypothetical protein [Clostridium sp. C8-1-8]
MKNIDFGKGIVTYNDFNIDITNPLENQIWELKQDLLQVNYSDKHDNTYILDIGWYPEFNLKGAFKIVLIRNFDWDNPMIMKKSNYEDFYSILANCVDYANRL